MRGSIGNQINQIWSKIDGIGKSKFASRNNSNLKAQSGHKVSDKVHSLNSKDEVLRTAKDLAKFTREHFKIKDMQAITNPHIQSFINNKIENELTYRSISTYISHLEKIQIGLSKFEQKLESHNHLFNREGLIKARQTAKEQALGNIHINRAYDNLNSIQSYLESKEAQISFQLQKQHGLRVTEATLLRLNQLKGNNILTIQGKGGYKQDIQLSKELYNEINNHIRINGSFKIEYNKYTKELKEAVSQSNQKWNSTHGIRYNFAQSKYQELMTIGKTDFQARQQVSTLMGHNRVEITNHYLR